jgi:carbon monoxide dehydrogenase subunit G
VEFLMRAELPCPPETVWQVMVDIPRIASCIPGCEEVMERAYLAEYDVILKQRIGPFRLEVPAQIFVDNYVPTSSLKARASGLDRLTRTKLSATLDVQLLPLESSNCRLSVAAELKIAGKLASLGHAIVKKKAEENFAEFERRLLAELERP